MGIILASDTFDRANENPLANGVWTTANSEVAMQIVGNVATPTDPTVNDDGSYYSGIAWPNDQGSKAKLTVNSTSGGDQGVALKVRQAAGAKTYYRLVVDHAATNNVTLSKFVAAVHTTIPGFPVTQAWSDGDTWELRAIGSILQIFLNGVQVSTDATDASISAGSPGIGVSTTVTSASVNDWEGWSYATIAFYLNNPVQGGSNSGLLDITAPTASTSTTGWTVGTTAINQYSRQTYNQEVLAAGFTSTAQPSGVPVNLSEDCYRLSGITTGQFSSGTWYSSLSVIGVSSGGIQHGRGRFRLWASANADGSSARELTQGTMIGSQITELNTTVAQSSSASTLIAASNLTNEFLFQQIAWETL